MKLYEHFKWIQTLTNCVNTCPKFTPGWAEPPSIILVFHVQRRCAYVTGPQVTQVAQALLFPHQCSSILSCGFSWMPCPFCFLFFSQPTKYFSWNTSGFPCCLLEQYQDCVELAGYMLSPVLQLSLEKEEYIENAFLLYMMQDLHCWDQPHASSQGFG